MFFNLFSYNFYNNSHVSRTNAGSDVCGLFFIFLKDGLYIYMAVRHSQKSPQEITALSQITETCQAI